MKIENHLLSGDKIDFKSSPNISGKFKTGLPDTIVIHYTAGSSRESSVNTLTSKSSKASAHLVIGRDGKITQLVPFDTIAWHAGNSSYKGRVGLNSYSIGIEIDNAGILKKSGNSYTAWFGRLYDEADVMEGVHRNRNTPNYWHRYTEWQIEICKEICQLLIEKYGIKTIVGHEEISPIRKIDPGPAFPLDKFREQIFDSARDTNSEEEPIHKTSGEVAATSLNIRVSHDAEAEKAAQPLPKGTKVEILEESEGWLKVRTQVEGWVFAKHIK